MLKRALVFVAGVLLGQYVAENYHYRKDSEARIKGYEEEIKSYKSKEKTSETEKES